MMVVTINWRQSSDAAAAAAPDDDDENDNCWRQQVSTPVHWSV